MVILAVGITIGWYLQRDDGSEENPAKAGSSVSATVEEVVDGDTARFLIDGESESVRYIGIDTPEMNYGEGAPECFAEEATARNEALLGRTGEARLVFDRERRDRYGRLLAYVYSGPALLPAELLQGGYATTIEVPPNTSRAKGFSKMEDEARRTGRGLWSACPGRDG